MLCRNLQTSTTCGSVAAWRISVTPSIVAAASRAVSVPVTDASSRYIDAACSPFGASSAWPVEGSTVAPRLTSASIWVPMVRRAGKSPPGIPRMARPVRASSGPSNRTDPRSLPTSSLLGSDVLMFWQRTRTVVVPRPWTSAPISFRSLAITSTSPMRGMLVSTHSSVVSRHAASSGSAAFLLPSTSMRPEIARPPSINRLDIKSLPGKRSLPAAPRRTAR